MERDVKLGVVDISNTILPCYAHPPIHYVKEEETNGGNSI
jgi:hypothetical protein